MPRSTSPRATASMLSRKPVPVRIQKRERSSERKRILAAIMPTTVWKLATPQSPTILSSMRGQSLSVIGSSEIDENFAAFHHNRIAAQLEDAVDAGRFAGSEVEAEEMPRADDHAAMKLAFGERPSRVRAARIKGDVLFRIVESRDGDLTDTRHTLAQDRGGLHLFGLAKDNARHRRLSPHCARRARPACRPRRRNRRSAGGCCRSAGSGAARRQR